MILDFTVIDKIDGLSIYAKKIFENIYRTFVNDQFLLPKDYNFNMIEESSMRRVRSKMLHRLKLGLFNKEFYYSPTHHGPIFNENKIITIHDITPMLIKNKSFKQYLYFSLFLKLSARNTKKIITVSQYTKDKLIEYYGLNNRSKDILVIHNATDIDVIKEQKVDDLPNRYVFLPGVHSEYKNYKSVIKAIEILSDPDLKLVLTTTNTTIIDYCRDHSCVITLSNLKYEEIKYIYLHSIGLVYPSIIEGFGFPALEASRLRIPILTTELSSMQEFLGENAAIYVNPFLIDSILDGLKKLIYEDQCEMIEISFNNTKHLTWKDNSKKVIEIIKGTHL